MATKKNKVGKVGKQNRNAGSHASYNKRKMSKAQILAKRAYDKIYGAQTKSKKARAALGRLKPAGPGKDNAHSANGKTTRPQSSSKNRANNRPKVKQTTAPKRSKPKAPNYKKHFRKQKRKRS